MDQAVVEMDQRVAHMADPLETQRSDESMEQDMQDVSNSLEMSMETQNA